MRRKDVSKRLTSVAEVRASLQAHRAALGEQLDARPAAQTAGALSQTYFDHLDGELAAMQNRLITAEDQHTEKLVRIAALRRQSADLTSALFDKQAASRQILMGLYGTESDFELAAASGRTPRAPETLAEQVDQTVKLLRAPELAPPDVRVLGVIIQFDTLADDLEAGLQQLRQIRADLQHTLKESDATRAHVKATIEELNGVFSWAARNLEASFRLAGQDELADRVRTSRRRATRRTSDDDSEEPPSTEEPMATEAPANEEPISNERLAPSSEPNTNGEAARQTVAAARVVPQVKSTKSTPAAESSIEDTPSRQNPRRVKLEPASGSP